MTRGTPAAALLGLALLPSCGPAPGGPPPAAAPHERPGVRATAPLAADRVAWAQTIYVPITSSVATADNGRPLNLAATLFVRNADPSRPIVVDAIRYFDSGGKPVRAFLERPVALAPLAALDLFVRESDSTGGPSPCFLVDCSAEADAAPPVVEAVMISTAGAQGITLTSVGRVVASRRR